DDAEQAPDSGQPGAFGDEQPERGLRARRGAVRADHGDCRERMTGRRLWSGVLEAAGVKVSMDGKGRCLDNVFVERLWRTVKDEDIHLRGYETVPELSQGLGRDFPFSNEGRPQ